MVAFRICWLDTRNEKDVPHIVTDTTERMQLPNSKRPGWQCLCSGVMRRATAEEVEAWRNS